MNEIATWFLIIGSVNGVFPPSRLGPVTEAECMSVIEPLRKIAPTIQARCRKAIGMYACEVRPGVGTSCPVFDDEMPRTGGSQ